MIKVVLKCVTKRKCRVGELALPGRANEAVPFGKLVERFFGRRGVDSQNARQHSGMELVSFDTGHFEQRAVILGQAPEFPLDHASHRLRQGFAQFRDGSRQLPTAVCGRDQSGVHEVAQQVHDKQGMPFRSLEDRRRKITRKGVVGELQFYIGPNVLQSQRH